MLSLSQVYTGRRFVSFHVCLLTFVYDAGALKRFKGVWGLGSIYSLWKEEMYADEGLSKCCWIFSVECLHGPQNFRVLTAKEFSTSATCSTRDPELKFMGSASGRARIRAGGWEVHETRLNVRPTDYTSDSQFTAPLVYQDFFQIQTTPYLLRLC